MENHHFSWVNPLFPWPFSIAMLNCQRVASVRVFWWSWLGVDSVLAVRPNKKTHRSVRRNTSWNQSAKTFRNLSRSNYPPKKILQDPAWPSPKISNLGSTLPKGLAPDAPPNSPAPDAPWQPLDLMRDISGQPTTPDAIYHMVLYIYICAICLILTDIHIIYIYI